MRDDFCVFILTHGRADCVHTYTTLQRAGYTGKIFIVIDDEDETADQYRERFGDNVLQFCKKDVAEWTDDGDNFGHRKSVIYARNICWDLARQVGCQYFIQLDDDYTSFALRFRGGGLCCCAMIRESMDHVLDAMVEFYASIPAASLCMCQGGDMLGGPQSRGNQIQLRRKAMNSFICSADRRFQFFGRINEDVSTYVLEGRRGVLFFTAVQVQLVQTPTQSNPGGWTEHYLDVGTYVKSFYSVMYAPSCVQIGIIGDYLSPHFRIHHKINWNVTAPKILREEWRKPCPAR